MSMARSKAARLREAPSRSSRPASTGPYRSDSISIKDRLRDAITGTQSFHSRAWVFHRSALGDKTTRITVDNMTTLAGICACSRPRGMRRLPSTTPRRRTPAAGSWAERGLRRNPWPGLQGCIRA